MIAIFKITHRNSFLGAQKLAQGIMVCYPWIVLALYQLSYWQIALTGWARTSDRKVMW
jgi:hypothetical protein